MSAMSGATDMAAAGTEYTKLYVNTNGQLQRDPVASESR